jgi:hypothetical protein
VRGENLQRPAHLEQLELLEDVDRGHLRPAPWMDVDIALEPQALQRLADRRAAAAQLLAQLPRDDHLLDGPIGAFGQRLRRQRQRRAVHVPDHDRTIGIGSFLGLADLESSD